MRRRALTLLAVALAAIAAVVGLTQGRFLGIEAVPEAPASARPTTAPILDPLANDPAPPLLPASAVEIATPVLAAQRRQTAATIRTFWGTNAVRTADDSAFTEWVTEGAPLEPSAVQRTAERAERNDLDRNARNASAARWLSAHGCNEVWLAYAVRDSEGGKGATLRAELRELLSLATTVATTAQFQHNPTVAPPLPCASATPLDAECECSYPSAAAVLSSAARTYLGRRLPRHDDRYAAMEKQVVTAGLYQRREVSSDIEEGARLGYLVGRYYLITRGYGDGSTADPIPAPAAP